MPPFHPINLSGIREGPSPAEADLGRGERHRAATTLQQFYKRKTLRTRCRVPTVTQIRLTCTIYQDEQEKFHRILVQQLSSTLGIDCSLIQVNISADHADASRSSGVDALAIREFDAATTIQRSWRTVYWQGTQVSGIGALGSVFADVTATDEHRWAEMPALYTADEWREWWAAETIQRFWRRCLGDWSLPLWGDWPEEEEGFPPDPRYAWPDAEELERAEGYRGKGADSDCD